MIYTLDRIFGNRNQLRTLLDLDGTDRWVTSVSLPLPDTFRGRIVAAWAVLSGRAVALRYPILGELEVAIGLEEVRAP